MRFCIIKIIFLISITLYYSPSIYAEEYDFSFDLKNSKVTQNAKTFNSTPTPSHNSWRIGMQASFLPNILESTAELVYGNFDDHTNTDFSDWDKYLLTLGVSGNQDNLGYGFNFYSVGQQYEGLFNSKYRHKKGRAGYDSWLSFTIKKLQIKAKYLKSWTKSSNKTNHSQTFDSWYELETSYPLTFSPLTEVSVTYGLGERRSFVTPDAIKTYQGSITLLKTNFRFVSNYFQFSTEAKQSRSENDIANRDNFKQNRLSFNSTLLPLQPFSILSSYSYSIDSHSSIFYKSKLDKIDSSLGLVYKPVAIPLNLKLTSRYKSYHSDDNLTHKDIVKFATQLNWKSIGSYTGLKSDWSAKFSFSKTIDYINSSHSFSDLSFNLLWKMPVF